MSVLINGTNGLIQAYDYQTPTTGFTYTFAAGTQTLVMNPAATLANGTITMPAAPSDGMTITISSSKEITALTLNGNTGQTVVGAVSYLPANTATAYVYRSANTSWFPMQVVPQLLNVPLGVGQTWQTFSIGTTRVYGTTYTNTTGRPILVSWSTSNCGNSAFNLVIGGTTIQYASAGNLALGQNLSQVVPSGTTYAINLTSGSATSPIWAELR